jgi:hypothetical protein
MSIRFVRPDTTTLKLPGGDRLIVRKRLSVGDTQDMMARSYIKAGDALKLEHNAFNMARATAYLLDWVQHDDPDASIRGVSIDDLTAILKRLEPESYREIIDAIDAHELAIVAEREAEKNGQDGEPNAPAISPSPFEPVGASSGSAH